MKGEYLNVEQKEFLKSQNMDKRKYLFISKSPESYRFLERSTNKEFDIRR